MEGWGAYRPGFQDSSFYAVDSGGRGERFVTADGVAFADNLQGYRVGLLTEIGRCVCSGGEGTDTEVQSGDGLCGREATMTQLAQAFDERLTADCLSKAVLKVELQEAEAVEIVFEGRGIMRMVADY